MIISILFSLGCRHQVMWHTEAEFLGDVENKVKLCAQDLGM